jgi:hypothetical protein
VGPVAIIALVALLALAGLTWSTTIRVAKEVEATSRAGTRIRLLRHTLDLLRAEAAATRSAVADTVDTVSPPGDSVGQAGHR